MHGADCVSQLVVAFPLCRGHSLLQVVLSSTVAHHLGRIVCQLDRFLYVHYITIITEDREEGDRDGVSGVLMLDVLDDAENRGGRGAREKPRGYAGGAELEKRSDIIFRF